MPRTIVLDSFPLSCLGKSRGSPPTVTDHCRQWAADCIAAGNPVRVPAITYYETLRELERLGATAQIGRLKVFCFSTPDRFIPLDTSHLEDAAKLWARARNAGGATAAPDALDGDVILAAQAQSLAIAPAGFVVATTNVAHLAPFVPADLWTNIPPGS
jgi:predicted nucleic acid-binding protein